MQENIFLLEQDPASFKALALICQAALNYRALAFDAEFDQTGAVKRLQISGPQRTFARVLVSHSFGLGREWGYLNTPAFHKILAHGDHAALWRHELIHEQMKVFKRNGWMVTNATGRFWLRPDCWPNWAEVKDLMRVIGFKELNFNPDEELLEMLAKISQSNAVGGPDLLPSGERFAGTKKRVGLAGERFAPALAPPEPKPPDPPGNPSRIARKTAESKSEPTAESELPNPGIAAPAARVSSVSSGFIREEVNFENRETDDDRINRIVMERHEWIASLLPVERVAVAARERGLMRDLKAVLGEDEMSRAGAVWRMYYVWPEPDITEQMLAELRDALRCGERPILNRGAWLIRAIKNEIGRREKATAVARNGRDQR